MANTPVKVLARGWDFEIFVNGLWIPIKGVNTFSVSPTGNQTDTTDFDSNGWLENMVASRGLGLTVEGFYLEDPSNGYRDPGQAAVEASGDALGPASLSTYRMTSPGGRVKTFSASAVVTTPGGGNDDAATWSAELTVSGQPANSSIALIAITVLPDAPTVSRTVNPTLQFTAIGVYDNASSRDITGLCTWTSATPATATIAAASGLATLVAVGTSVITATLGAKTDTSLLTVTT